MFNNNSKKQNVSMKTKPFQLLAVWILLVVISLATVKGQVEREITQTATAYGDSASTLERSIVLKNDSVKVTIIMPNDTNINVSIYADSMESKFFGKDNDERAWIGVGSTSKTMTIHPSRIWDFSAYFSYGYIGLGKNICSFNSVGKGMDLNWSSAWDMGLTIQTYFSKHWGLSGSLGFQSLVMNLDEGEIFNSYLPLPEGASDVHNKLVARYITLPIMVNYRINSDFIIRLGVIPGLNYRCGHTGFKRTYDLNGIHHEESTGTSFKGFNPVKLDAQIAFKYDCLSVFYRQGITKMFKGSQHIDAYPFTIGMQIGF